MDNFFRAREKCFQQVKITGTSVTKNQQASGNKQESSVSPTSFSSQPHIFHRDANTDLSLLTIHQVL